MNSGHYETDMNLFGVFHESLSFPSEMVEITIEFDKSGALGVNV